jgi:23S rRNA pseudouridine1911/1915/1917 synthase
MSQLVAVLHEDADLLVLNKPAGLVCHPTKGDAHSSLISRVRLHLQSSGTPHLINRLDRETSGVVLVGKTLEAAREIRRLWEAGAVQKQYLAIVHGAVELPHGVIDAPLAKDEQSPVAIKDCVRPDGAPALTEFWTRLTFGHPSGQFSLLEVRPHSGRKHQIRIHLASRGHPIVGDKLYGLDERFYLAFVESRLTDADRERLLLPLHALHAREIRFVWRGRERTFQAGPEPWFTEFVAAGGMKDAPSKAARSPARAHPGDPP